MISHDRLLYRLNYNPDTGDFIWKNNRDSTLIGTIAGTILEDGRWQIQVDSRLYKAHRLAWFYVYGKWPEDQLDHIDGNPLNNRLSNLRECSQTQNQQNQFKPKAHNKTGYLGVSWDSSRKKYAARIRVDGKYKYLGRFDSVEEAAQSYLEAKRKYHPFFVEENVKNLGYT